MSPTILVDPVASPTADSTAAALRDLAAASVGHRAVAVLGPVDPGAETVVDAHDRLGRLVVRLGIELLVVVGDGARHLHAAAGLEGSWDGESVIVDDAEAAYDALCDFLRPDDVVLVTSPLAGLAARLEAIAG